MGNRFFERKPLSAQSPQRRVFSAIFAISAVSVFVVTVAVAQQPDRAATEALARRATERLQALQAEADRLALQERTLLGELRKLEIERQLRSEEMKRLAGEAGKVEAELASTSERMETLQTSERAAQPELRARLVEIYKLGQARYLRLILRPPTCGIWVRRRGRSRRWPSSIGTASPRICRPSPN